MRWFLWRLEGGQGKDRFSAANRLCDALDLWPAVQSVCLENLTLSGHRRVAAQFAVELLGGDGLYPPPDQYRRGGPFLCVDNFNFVDDPSVVFSHIDLGRFTGHFVLRRLGAPIILLALFRSASFQIRREPTLVQW